MEAAVRWSSQSIGGSGRFLIVDVSTQSLSLNQVTTRSRTALEHTNVARYERLPKFGAFDWSKTDDSLVALGLVSGSACIVKLRDDDRDSEIATVFKLRQERKCNSIALSTRNWLAAGLDKTRSDWCLNIFDANIDGNSHPEPIRRLCSAEVVSSVRFFPRHPEEVVVAAQRSVIRLYDLRDGYLGSAGNSNLQIATRNVNNIAIDPLDENYFASAGSADDPSVTVWDRRWILQSHPSGSSNGSVFEFRPAVNNSSRVSIWSLRYSGQQRGRLAICASTGALTVVDMMESQNSHLQASEYLPVNPYGGTPWSCNRFVSQMRNVRPPYSSDDARRDPDGHNRVMAFDWMSDGNINEQPIIALHHSRRIDVLRVPTSIPVATVTARRDFCVAFGHISINETKVRLDSKKPDPAYTMQSTAEDFGPVDYNGEEAERDNLEGVSILQHDSPRTPVLFASSTIQRERCRQGYLFDCEKNRGIVAGNWQLERLWEVVGRFREQATEGSMVAEGLDLSYIGVYGIWSESIGPSETRRLSFPLNKVEDAIFALNTSREFPAFEGERTSFPEHRQLCLGLCGWKFTTDTLEAECQELIERGLYYQAIVQAVLHDYKHIALNLLRTLIRSKKVSNIGLGALLASDSINNEQREMCQWMAADTEDPALKALLVFLTTGDWRDVMKTTYLSLDYRMALGLKYLNDTELSGFIQSETARAVKNGDLEGILLTGLGEQSIDLLQTYMTKTNDLQTVVLATAVTNPLFVDDIRWDMWKETYFMQMQSWRAFNERTRFVVQHSQMAKAKDGRSLLEPPSPQVTLRCYHCQASLARHDAKPGKAVTAPAMSAGIVCPRCKRHMPRCGICKLWLGTPDPTRKGGAKELLKLEDMLAKFMTFCVKCGHGFHADHARSWFQKYSICPVTDCQCRCALK